MAIKNKAGFVALCDHLDQLTRIYGKQNVYVIGIRNDIAAINWYGTICYLDLEDIEGLTILQTVECLTNIANHEKAKINFEKEVEA